MLWLWLWLSTADDGGIHTMVKKKTPVQQTRNILRETAVFVRICSLQKTSLTEIQATLQDANHQNRMAWLQFAKTNPGKVCYGQTRLRINCIGVMIRRKCLPQKKPPKIKSTQAHQSIPVVIAWKMQGCYRCWHTYLHWWCNCWWHLHNESWGV